MAFELDPCRVVLPSGELVAEGFVREQADAGLVLELPRFGGRWVVPGDAVVAQLKSAVRGECTYDAVVGEVAAGTMQLTGLRLREALQKRGAVRAVVAIPARARLVGETGQPSGEPLDVVVQDVSATGMRVSWRDELPAGTQLVVDLAAEGFRMEVPLRVLRSIPHGTVVSHGCVVDGLRERQTDELFGFVLAEQRRQRAARMDMLDRMQG